MHIFEVMAEPIRRRIVEVLASGDHYVGDVEAVITHEFGVGRPAVQHHLRLLRDHGFVRMRDEWPWRSCRLDDDVVAMLEREVRRLKRRWIHRIGWSAQTDPLPKHLRPSARGRRGRGIDPDDPWVRSTAPEPRRSSRAPLP
jgi:DNA-binding transcriptional ArsR family regulator